MSQPKDNMTPFLSSKEIQETVYRLAKEIEIDYHGKEIILICPLKGSTFFCSDLMKNMNLPQKVDFVYLKSTEKGGTIKMIKDLTVNVTGKHVIIVEEIIDIGRTLNFLKSRLMASNPASLKVVALLDKPARREIPLKPDYVGITIDDRYVVGYGMDSDEFGRNYSDIYTFKM